MDPANVFFAMRSKVLPLSVRTKIASAPISDASRVAVRASASCISIVYRPASPATARSASLLFMFFLIYALRNASLCPIFTLVLEIVPAGSSIMWLAFSFDLCIRQGSSPWQISITKKLESKKITSIENIIKKV
jgi:hypothetical protein